MTIQTARLDLQLDQLNIAYDALPEGLPRSPSALLVMPVLANINNQLAFVLMDQTSALIYGQLPDHFQNLESLSPERILHFTNQYGLKKITLLCHKAPVYIDRRLLAHEKLILPVGDKTHYLALKTNDLVSELGQQVTLVDLPQMDISPEPHLNESVFSRKRIEAVMKGIDSLPPFPGTARKIIELSMSDDYNVSMIVDILKTDAMVASHILGLANSAMFSTTHSQVSTIHQAVMRLGTLSTMHYAMQLSMMRSFRVDAHLTHMVRFAAYNSLLCAFGGRQVAISRGHAHDTNAYLIGLMHNLGELLMISHYPEQAGLFSTLQSINPHLSREALSRHVFKVGFATCTDVMMESWNQPDIVRKTLADMARLDHLVEGSSGHDIRTWQVALLDEGHIPYSHAPQGWRHIPTQKDNSSLVKRHAVDIEKFLSYSQTMSSAATRT